MMVDTGDIVRVKILKGGLWKSPRLHSSLGTYHMEFMSLCPTQMFSSWDSCDKEMHPNAPNGQISAHIHSLTHSYRHRAFEELKIFGWLKNTHCLKLKLPSSVTTGSSFIWNTKKVGDNFVFNAIYFYLFIYFLFNAIYLFLNFYWSITVLQCC